MSPQPPADTTSPVRLILRLMLVVVCLYVFLVSIQLLGASFQVWRPLSEALVGLATYPPVGVVVGILATTIVQSSSTSTSIVVGMIGAGTMPVGTGVFVVMGCNIGTTVTNSLVSLAHVTRKNEFRRAFAGASIHDVFNLATVFILVPVEWSTGIIQASATGLTGYFDRAGGLRLVSPVQRAVSPVSDWLFRLVEGVAPEEISLTVIGLLVSGGLMVIGLSGLVKNLRGLFVVWLEKLVGHPMVSHPVGGLFLGLVATILVQSSSITTSLMVPLAGAGVLSLTQILPMTLGANLGTTFTALLAAMATVAAPEAALSIALVHLLFNILGIALVYLVPPYRRWLVRLVREISVVVADHRAWGVVYVIGFFYAVPALIAGTVYLLL